MSERLVYCHQYETYAEVITYEKYSFANQSKKSLRHLNGFNRIHLRVASNYATKILNLIKMWKRLIFEQYCNYHYVQWIFKLLSQIKTR